MRQNSETFKAAQLSLDLCVTIAQAATIRSCSERAIRFAIYDHRVAHYRDSFSKKRLSYIDLLACDSEVLLEKNLPPPLVKRGPGRPRKLTS
jgi:hypothetical protein